MAAEEGVPAPLLEAGLDGLNYLELEKELVRLGTRYHVLAEDGRELFQIERPASQAAVSETFAVAVDVLASSGKHHHRRDVNLGTRLEHAMARHYEMWTLDDRWLGRIEKASGSARPAWTLFLSDWQPFAWVDVTSAGYGPLGAVVLDATGAPALSLNVAPYPGPTPILDPWGRPAGDLSRALHGLRDVVVLRTFAPVHPIYFVFLAVVHDYEIHPGQ